MKKTIKLLAVFLAVLLTLSLLLPFTLSAAEPTSQNKANYILLYCLSTDTMLFEKNSDFPVDPGYTSQMMTALLALEYDPDLSKNITLSADLLASWDFPADFRSYLDYGFKKNTSVPVKDLLAVMMLENATCAAKLLAATIGGSVDNFVTMMNDRAKELGMETTVFANPTGASSSTATTTLSDLFKLVTLLYQNEQYMSLASAKSYVLANNGFKIYTRNYLIGTWYTTADQGYYYANATGMKSDSAFERNNPLRTSTLIATSREKDNYDYLCMVMGASGDSAYGIAKDFFKWGSTDFRSLKVISREKLYKHLPVEGGDRMDQVPIFPEKDLTAYLPSSITLEDVTYQYSLSKKELSAPLSYGTKVGEIKAIVNDKIVASCNLIVGSHVPQAKESQVYGVVGSILLSPLVIIAILILIGYLIYKYDLHKPVIKALREKIKNQNKNNQNKKR